MLQFTLDNFTKEKDFPFFIQYGKHDDALELHSHKDFSELVIVTSGNAVHVVGEELFPVSKGDVFVISNHTAHAYQATDHFRLCNIMFSPEKLQSIHSDLTKSAGFQALFIIEPHYTKNYHFTSHLHLSVTDFIQVMNLISEMVFEYQASREGRQTLLSALFIYLITILSRLYQNNSDSDHLKILALANAVSYLHNHFTDDITVSHLANLSGYSTRQFYRIFKETYANAPLEYIQTLRLEYACQLLKETSSSISLISSTCGFDNPNYFSRLYKKRFGITPSEYRKGR